MGPGSAGRIARGRNSAWLGPSRRVCTRGMGCVCSWRAVVVHPTVWARVVPAAAHEIHGAPPVVRVRVVVAVGVVTVRVVALPVVAVGVVVVRGRDRVDSGGVAGGAA